MIARNTPNNIGGSILVLNGEEFNMTGYTVHTGSNEKFTGGWDKIFGGTSKSPTARKSTGKKRTTKKKKKKAN